LQPLKIHLIAAARPNFMKIAPLYHALAKEVWAEPVIVHTGQHYDINMSDAFFKDLELPDPHIHLGVGSGSHAEQTANVMTAYEKVLLEGMPDLVVVVGDVNSTMACTLAASKISYSPPVNRHRPFVAHLEAGLRSNDRSMPEEINRLVTDVLADVLWTPSEDAVENLLHEGIAPNKIVNVGNIMIDSLELMRDKIERLDVPTELGINRREYGLITLHRPSNVDSLDSLSSICRMLIQVSQRIPFVFPVHPRTRKNLDKFGLMDALQDADGIILTEPMSYIRFMSLVFDCKFVITDSGGIQEETTYLGIPCLTMRPNTERPVTVSQGTNQLCSLESLDHKLESILAGEIKPYSVPAFWDGNTADRIVDEVRIVSKKRQQQSQNS
jgi:UDP-N-acetylglucosamine 2-epimerase (non-hydrolysing)